MSEAKSANYIWASATQCLFVDIENSNSAQTETHTQHNIHRCVLYERAHIHIRVRTQSGEDEGGIETHPKYYIGARFLTLSLFLIPTSFCAVAVVAVVSDVIYDLRSHRKFIRTEKFSDAVSCKLNSSCPKNEHYQCIFDPCVFVFKRFNPCLACDTRARTNETNVAPTRSNSNTSRLIHSMQLNSFISYSGICRHMQCNHNY